MKTDYYLWFYYKNSEIIRSVWIRINIKSNNNKAKSRNICKYCCSTELVCRISLRIMHMIYQLYFKTIYTYFIHKFIYIYRY